MATLGSSERARPETAAPLRAYAGAVALVAASTAIAALMAPHFELSNLTMVYLLGVVVAAAVFGRGPAIVAAVLSVAVFDFAFVPPRFTFRVTDTQYLVTFAVMLVVAVVIGTLTAWVGEQADAARQREERTAALYRLTHDLAGCTGAREVLSTAAARLGEALGASVVALAPGEDGELAVFGGDGGLLRDESRRSAALRAYENGQLVGFDSPSMAENLGLYAPLDAGTRSLGVLAVLPERAQAFADPERLALLRAMAGQTALALERARLAVEASSAREQAETERARSALLSSVSHDLRTPLAVITGAATSLRDGSVALPEATRRELADTITEEALRLNRLIGNLLEMTRLESGTLRVHKEWHSIEEVVGSALARLDPVLGDRPIELRLAADLPLVPLDDVLFEQVVVNLVENAHKYSPPGRPIGICAAVEHQELLLEVTDQGSGLAPGDEARVFQKFYRGPNVDSRPGAGLGLAICQGIVHAHGGRIEARNHASGGAAFTVRLPLGGPPPVVEAETAALAEPLP